MIPANTIVGGRYRVARSLGGGGMKLVYLAEDLRLAARPCALAEMVDTFTNPQAQQQAVASFQREADMLAELNHEHIPRIYDRFSDANRHYLVMEYVDGQTLEERLKLAGGKLPEGEVVDLALQILDTLVYLHGLNPAVIYRDLKPSNVMITHGGELKLIDFGIARHFQPASNATMIGTQGYAPPEQYRGKVEVRSDLYALGATMHHAISGRDPTAEPPFSFPPLKKLAPNCNTALADLIGEALSYDIEHRMASAQEFKRRLLLIKIEVLTGGLVDQADAAAAITATITSAKPQLKLPLGSRAPAAPSRSTPASPSAPTVLSQASDVPCFNCNRLIPSDSRFCSYCAAELKTPMHNGSPAHASPEAQTMVLSQTSNSQDLAYQSGVRYREPRRKLRRGRGANPIAMTLMVIVSLWGVMHLLPFLAAVLNSLGGSAPAPNSLPPPSTSERYSSPDSGDVVPPEETSPEARSEPVHRTPRALALRRALDGLGYRSVHFRLNGTAIDLWGTVESETDRIMVQHTVFTVSGAVSLNDHLQVEDSFASP